MERAQDSSDSSIIILAGKEDVLRHWINEEIIIVDQHTRSNWFLSKQTEGRQIKISILGLQFYNSIYSIQQDTMAFKAKHLENYCALVTFVPVLDLEKGILRRGVRNIRR